MKIGVREVAQRLRIPLEIAQILRDFKVLNFERNKVDDSELVKVNDEVIQMYRTVSYGYIQERYSIGKVQAKSLWEKGIINEYKIIPYRKGHFPVFLVKDIIEKDDLIKETIKPRKIRARIIPLTLDNVFQSLYVVNKSAKKSRDTKRSNYFFGKHNIVQSAKTRQEKLYDLKTQVLNKLLGEGIAQIVGVHVQQLGPELEENYLLLIKCGNYTFHEPCYSDEAANYKIIGQINELISQTSKIESTIKFGEALDVLSRYLSGKMTITGGDSYE